MALVWSIQDIRLLTEEGVALVNDVLHDLGTGPPILNPERGIRTALVVSMVDVLLVELRNTALTVSSAMRGLLDMLWNAEIARENAMNIFKACLLAIAILLLLNLLLLVINRL